MTITRPYYIYIYKTFIIYITVICIQTLIHCIKVITFKYYFLFIENYNNTHSPIYPYD